MKKLFVLIFSFIILSSSVLAQDYTGNLKVFVVEPYSRFQDANLDHYKFGFLGFALDLPVDLKDKETLDTTALWDGNIYGYGDIQSDNIMAQAVMFNSDPIVSDAYPPNGYWFLAYYADAACQAGINEIGQHQIAPNFTHTVYLEEGTSSG
ncbi:MAG: hypothetical protein DWP97_02555 [Calditrichaeota bacterium]|nr:MAG: hypothetical protein DWP97_02555 [Calditrichota bacterium]